MNGKEKFWPFVGGNCPSGGIPGNMLGVTSVPFEEEGGVVDLGDLHFSVDRFGLSLEPLSMSLTERILRFGVGASSLLDSECARFEVFESSKLLFARESKICKILIFKDFYLFFRLMNLC